ncbi:hypothetical protein GS399_06260 [Pedobacter sp. HMF7647]|uniref:Uncharacterized protein n=1 Tax=Hufsiella arboris TaxID=2695275 RepID=A0A7K1Y876_9SPHI|nr:hypothetical protein [Hufsiella arboris]MXV50571.1 hypothetical protein [Hufsiella arboris]
MKDRNSCVKLYGSDYMDTFDQIKQALKSVQTQNESWFNQKASNSPFKTSAILDFCKLVKTYPTFRLYIDREVPISIRRQCESVLKQFGYNP